jgi:DNA-binding response OmpR family regulator
MTRDEEERTAYYSREESKFVYEEVERQRQKNDRVAPRPGYLVELSGEAIPLEEIEFRILTFLSATPYRAYTRRQIIEAVQTEESPVTEEGLEEHIRSLRDKLGLFSDYVQSVPHVGYRFKA